MKLSFCIPTHNRGKYIGNTIQSILSQWREGVEIVISDNASDDKTEEIVRSFHSSAVHYHRFPENVGADRNFLRVIDLANGEFCCLMGSDDQVEAGAVDRIFDILEKHPSLTGISFRAIGYDREMKKEVSRPVSYPTDHLFVEWKECFRRLYFHLTYISTQFFRKSYWVEAIKQVPVEKYFNGFVYLLVIGKMIQTHGHWMYCHQRAIGWRSGNDSFLAYLGYYKRCVLDVGTIDILEELCPENRDIKRAFMNQLMQGQFKTHLKLGLFHQKSASELKKIRQFCFSLFWKYPRFWFHLAPWIFVPAGILRGLRSIYRKWAYFLNESFAEGDAG